MSLTLAGACAAIMPLAEGQYFVSVMAVMPFAPSGQVAWNPNTSANGAEYAFQDPDGLLGPGPCNTWGAGTTCGIPASSPDLCFSLDGTVVTGENPSVVEVPTLSYGGIALLAALLGLAALVALRRS